METRSTPARRGSGSARSWSGPNCGRRGCRRRRCSACGACSIRCRGRCSWGRRMRGRRLTGSAPSSASSNARCAVRRGRRARQCPQRRRQCSLPTERSYSCASRATRAMAPHGCAGGGATCTFHPRRAAIRSLRRGSRRRSTCPPRCSCSPPAARPFRSSRRCPCTRRPLSCFGWRWRTASRSCAASLRRRCRRLRPTIVPPSTTELRRPSRRGASSFPRARSGNSRRTRSCCSVCRSSYAASRSSRARRPSPPRLGTGSPPRTPAHRQRVHSFPQRRGGCRTRQRRSLSRRRRSPLPTERPPCATARLHPSLSARRRRPRPKRRNHLRTSQP